MAWGLLYQAWGRWTGTTGTPKPVSDGIMQARKAVLMFLVCPFHCWLLSMLRAVILSMGTVVLNSRSTLVPRGWNPSSTMEHFARDLGLTSV